MHAMFSNSKLFHMCVFLVSFDVSRKKISFALEL